MTRTFVRSAVLLVTVLAAGCSSAPSPDDSTVRGNEYFKAKKYPEAIVELRKALTIDPKLGDARYKLAQSYEATGNQVQAYNEFVRAADLLPESLEAQLKAGEYLLRATRYEDAKTRAQSALALDPKNVEAQILRGNAAAGMKDFAAAMADLEQAIQMDPGDERGYTQLATLKVSRGQLAEAEAAFLEAVKVKPDSVKAKLGLAGFYWGTGRAAEAEPIIQETLRLEPDNMPANRALAAFYQGTGRVAEAEAPLKRVLELAKDLPARLALADYYIQTDRVPEALPLLTEAAKDQTGVSETATRLAAIDYTAKRTADAHKRLDEVLKQDPRHVPAMLMKTRFLLAENKVDEALKQVQAAVAVDQASVPAQYLLGTIYRRRRDVANASVAFKEVLKLNPRATLAQAELAQLSMESSAAAAVDYAEQAVKNAPRIETRRLRVQALANSGQLDRASTELLELLKAEPKYGDLHADAGRIALLKGNKALARKEFELARQLAPDSYDAVSGLVGLELADRKPAEARKLVDAYIAKFPKSPKVYLLSAAVNGAAGKVKEQEADFRKVLEVDPDNLEAYGGLAGLFLRTRRVAEARKEYETLASRQPKALMPPTMVALLFELENNPAEARKWYEKVVAISPEAAVASNNLAWIYAEKGENLDVALQLAQTAVRKAPDSAPMLDTLGWIQLKQERYPAAAEAFEKGASLSPKVPEYQYHLGLAHQKLGNFAKSKQAFEAALKLKPDYKDARTALDALTKR